MSISKKIRFEVFKRDGFVCGYCGQSPPAVILEVDHIDPKSKGGKDDINNLITACFDCNRGKKNIPLDKTTPKLTDNLEVLKEKEDQLREYRKFIKKLEGRVEKDIAEINKIYSQAFEGWEFSEQFKDITLKKFLNSLPKHEIVDALKKAIYRVNHKDQVIKYFCGICWKKIKGFDNSDIIIREWKTLSKEHNRGSGYYNKADVKEIAHMWNEWMRGLMIETLSERRQSYWAHFMNLVYGGNYEG